MDLQLTGKQVLITGASRGIGLAVAEVFAQEGAVLHLSARDTGQLKQVASRLTSQYDIKVHVHAADLRESDQLADLAARTSEIDVLVNNAGDISGGSILNLPEDSWRHAWDLKVFGYINLTRIVYQTMKMRGGGVIVNNIGAAGERPNFNYIAGAAGNAALMHFTRSLGSRSLFDRVRVVGVNPGSVMTSRLEELKRKEAARRWGDESQFARTFSEMPLGRPAMPSEVADLIAFLASPRAGYISGSIHTIDGGGVTQS